MKKGFTLIELLAVIVILAVILAIAVPGISGILNNSARNAFESDAKMLLKQIDYKTMEDSTLKPTDITESTITTLLGLSNVNYQTISVSSLKGKPYVIIQGKNKWDGLVAYGIYTDIKVTAASNYTTVVNQIGYDTDKGANEPKLTVGMTPIKWNGTSWVDTTASDSDWYNYNTTDKKWANARTKDGSMWVWIPRYIYRITTGWHSSTTGTIDVQFSKGIDDNWNSLSIGNISIDTTANASNGTWTNHPAFTFGTTELTGMWIAKFEPTAVEGVANGYNSDESCPISSDNSTTKTIKIIPNATSWRCITIGSAYIVTRKMEANSVYGWPTASGLQANGIFSTDTNNIDTHLIKNPEWGAVAYLSKSTYGKNSEIWNNPANTFTTGCSGTSTTSVSTIGCTNTYDSTNGVQASTTGNIYGIYDMSGGASERSSAYVDNANGNLTYGSQVISADSKYKDIYTKEATENQATSYALTINKKGDAIYETSNSYTGSTSWYGDYSNMPVGGDPWFMYGGKFSSVSPGIFNFNCTNGGLYGSARNSISFRPVLLVNTGL